MSGIASAALFLLFVAGTGGLTLWLRRGPVGLARRGRRLRLVERLELGERRFVAIVRLDGEELLIGGAAGAVSLLGALPAREEESAPIGQTRTGSFARLLERAFARGGGGAR
jgi:flagellar biogenesis protein FliO